MFKDFKSYLASPPILSQPEPKEDLYMYLAVSVHAVSSVLIRQHKGIQSQYITSAKLWWIQRLSICH